MSDFNLPNEIWCKIFSYLPLAPKKNATATCKLWFRLIREDPKLSGYIVISWCNMETALERLQWNWSNWPALKTLELNKVLLLELGANPRHCIQNIIETLSLKDYCPPSLEEVLFYVDLTPEIQTDGQSLLLYQPHTDQIFGFDENLDSTKKWNEYELNMNALIRLKRLKSMMNRPFNRLFNRTVRNARAMGLLPPDGNLGARIVAGLEAALSNDLLLLNESPYFQCFRRICVAFPWDMQYTELEEFLNFALSEDQFAQFLLDQGNKLSVFGFEF